MRAPMKVDFYHHDLTAADAAAMAAVVATPFLTTGPVCRAVEDRLRAYFDLPHAALVNSWTNGAIATLMAMGIGPGDEVIVPAQTFIATANVVEVVGATPVFADVDPDTLLMEAEHVLPLLTPRTRAVMPVHLYGRMVDIERLRAALPPAVRVIEDCAHCFEGTLRGARPGAWSDAAIFSFYATKNVACGEGGAIVTRDADLHALLMETRLHGMSAIAADRFRGGVYNHWDMNRLGMKANLPDLLAALLPGQIDSVDARLGPRSAAAARYDAALAGGPLRRPAAVADCVDALHLYVIHVPFGLRDAAIAALNAAGVGVTVNYRAVPTMRFYRERYPGAAAACPVSVEWGEGTLSLPLYPSIPPEAQDHVIATLVEAVYPLIEQARSGSRPA